MANYSSLTLSYFPKCLFFIKMACFYFFCVCVSGGVLPSGTCVSASSWWPRLGVSVSLLLSPAPEKSLRLNSAAFWEAGALQLLRGHAHFIPCVPWPSPAGAEFSLWWSMGWCLLQLWFLPRAPRGSRRSWSSPRTLWGSSGAWLSRALGSLKCPCSPWDRWHLSLLWGDGGKTEY